MRCDRSSKRQARRAASPKELADACDTIVISLPTLMVFRQAIEGSDGLLAGKAPNIVRVRSRGLAVPRRRRRAY